MHSTPWTRKVAPSSLPSDRLRPKPSPAPSRSKSSQSNQEPAPPQSKALRILNGLRTSLQDPSTSTTPDPTGGCFCQAPAHLCPSCKEPLLTPIQRSTLITRIETEIADTILKEQLACERAEEERRAAAGAFPSLQGSGSSYPSLQSSSHRLPPPPEPQTYKVLSLGSKAKRTTLTTTTIRPKASVTPSPQDSRPTSPQPIRQPRPHASSDKRKGKARVDPARLWANLNGDTPIYIPPVLSIDEVDADSEERAGTRKRRRRKGKGKEKGTEEGSEGKENMQAGLSGVGTSKS
ncbi:hypothetical protein C0992_006961 [Termitomyces sp. T32_za158]|nr:hypothetical protein C0992_006961 [Termitomyces sp. T32_za158]